MLGTREKGRPTRAAQLAALEAGFVRRLALRAAFDGGVQRQLVLKHTALAGFLTLIHHFDRPERRAQKSPLLRAQRAHFLAFGYPVGPESWQGRPC